MEFKKEKSQNWYLLDTDIENIYISEYMTAAPGDYVKVYLLAMMYAGLGTAPDIRTMAKQLLIKEQVIHDAWTYWEDLGIVRKLKRRNNEEEYDIEFLSLREKLYGTTKQKETVDAEKSISSGELLDEEIEMMYASIERLLGRPLGGNEPFEIISWNTDLSASPEMIVYAYNYCIKVRKKESVRYVGAVIKEWCERGLYTKDKIEEYLAENDRKYFLQKRIFKALGFSRNATEAEAELINEWFDKKGYTIDVILDACARTRGISNPNLNYVDKVLDNWRAEEKIPQKSRASSDITPAGVLSYYDFIRETAQKEAKRRRKHVYEKLPEIKKTDAAIRELSMKVSKAMLSGKRADAAGIREEIEGLLAERARLLTENGFEADYTEDKYLCPYCKDTGTTDTGERCGCFEQRQKEAREWQISLKK